MNFEEKNIMVSICCITFNHEPYIRECLDGFVMQKCDFEFEILIHDDASTDRTQEIIKEYQEKYPHLIKPIFQTENQWSQGVRAIQSTYNFSRAKGKYIALCEGDDYWTDPLKLKKQVDFLEENPEYIISCHNYKILDFDGKNINGSYEETFVKNKLQIEIDEKLFLKHWLTKTLTVVLLNNPRIIAESQKINKKRDLSLFYTYIRHGKGVFHNFNGGIYRKQKEGIHSSHTAIEAEIETKTILEDLYLIYKSPYLKKKISIIEYNLIYYSFKKSDKKTIPLSQIYKLKVSFHNKLKLLFVLVYNSIKS